jgi:hypothetical protein
MKNFLIAAMLGVATLAHANSFTVCSSVYGKNNYDCSLSSSSFSGDITGCTFTFDSCYTRFSGLLSCNLKDTSGSYTCGSSGQRSWTCSLDSNGLNYLNNCLDNSDSCDFNLFCGGDWHCGSCTVTYTCSPGPKRNVPDTATTVFALGLALLTLEVTRRKLAPAK